LRGCPHAQNIPLPAQRRTTVKSPAPADIVIGRNVRARRLERGMSQSALARALGLTFQQVQRYELGINRIGGGRLARIAELFGVPVAALFDGAEAGAQPRHASLVRLIADKEPLRLVQAFARVEDRRARTLIIALTELFAKKQAP
jgi:transcriptional regulator with XRE-family HTH domain